METLNHKQYDGLSCDKIGASNMEKSYDVNIAIDFGTDGLGIAYSFKQDVYIQNKWNDTNHNNKIKCIALFDHNRKLKSFGINAKHEYMNNSLRRKQWMLFENFKMALYGMIGYVFYLKRKQMEILYLLYCPN